MVSKEEEKFLYKAIYELAFDREAQFFYKNESDVILDFLKEKFWGESLEIRITLLCKLLDYDADVNPPFKKELKKKSKALKLFLTSLHPAADPPFSKQ
jgi:hypothetical protein